MKKIIVQLLLFVAVTLLFFSSCNNCKNKNIENEMIDYNSKSFDDLFKKVDVKDCKENFIELAGTPSVLTSGDSINYNSMAIGWGAYGTYFQKPCNTLFIRANRYTLEFIKECQTYTICYFDTVYLDQVLHFGKTSGRDSDKMGTHNLHSVFTPSSLPAYKEAKIIIECKLMQISTVSPDDYYYEESKNFINDAYKEAGDYHKIVIGEITNIWIKK